MLMDRGFGARNRRVRSLDVESYQDFMLGFRGWTYGTMDQAARASAAPRLAALAEADATPSIQAVRGALAEDPMVATRIRCWLSSQQLMWRNVLDHYDMHGDAYRAELAAADAAGPGTLELNTGMPLPDYVRHEIHLQPGGYTGNDFAGSLYHYGTNTFYRDQNTEDEFSIALAAGITLPADGKVERIVDLGCGVGRVSVALAERFPDAEVWGLDAGGPMVRYAHQRANDLGVAVHFAQRLAEDTKFADDSVDLVNAYILFHEVEREAAPAVCAEVFRILRPGGVFDVTDFHTGDAAPTEPYARYLRWIDHVYNAERWSHDFVYSDFLTMLRDAGFEVEKGANRQWGIAAYIARKPA